MGDVLHFPPQAVKCKGCGFPIALRRGEEPPEEALCFCCRHQIRLPGAHVHDGQSDACESCGGAREVVIPDESRFRPLVRQVCMDCGGTGKKRDR